MSRLSYVKTTTTSAAPFLCDVGWLLNFVDSQWSYGWQMPRRRSLIVSIFFFPQVTASGPIKNISWILLYLCDLHFGFDCLIYDFFSVSFQGIFGFRWTSTHRRFSIFSGPRLTGDLRSSLNLGRISPDVQLPVSQTFPYWLHVACYVIIFCEWIDFNGVVFGRYL
jgi:hypothetical protein